MNHVFNAAVLASRTTAEQHARFSELARTESALASDLGISRHRLRLMRFAGCAPRATRFDGTVYYSFEEISMWLRPYK